jgi:hypothetical protein
MSISRVSSVAHFPERHDPSAVDTRTTKRETEEEKKTERKKERKKEHKYWQTSDSTSFSSIVLLLDSSRP